MVRRGQRGKEWDGPVWLLLRSSSRDGFSARQRVGRTIALGVGMVERMVRWSVVGGAGLGKERWWECWVRRIWSIARLFHCSK